MKTSIFLIFLIFGTIVFSGCLREYDNVVITSADVMSSREGEGTSITITTYIQNNQKTDTGTLNLKVKIRDSTTNLIAAQKDSDIGYIKGTSSTFSTTSLSVSNPGEYGIEIQLFEAGKMISEYSSYVSVKATAGPGQPAEIKMADMTLVVTKLYNDASGAIVDVSPGIFNEGGDSKPLAIEVTARADAYTAYTKTDEPGILKSGSRVRAKVTFDLPRNREYTITVSVIENGKTLVMAKVNDKIKLKDIKVNTPVTLALIEEGKPITAATSAGTPKEPGFEAVSGLLGLMIVFCLMNRTRNGR
ncbi:MAG: hypothetical protein J5U17_02355 [Candidatus Methanoperedens sp.]|nr:hypothetical protein [Candidatus Methanoperedens sp.]MCE8424601.1 hypothetical protein [Candidatus Methanoperedens sp.]MCE8428673.1 hypothetical protein [Candidatus Methanoperedens sp.]